MIRVDSSNAEQLESWDGRGGAYWAEHADRFDAVMSGYDQAFFEVAAVAPTDRVLDIGCGNGHTSREAARRATEGAVLGVDLSTAMIEVARRLAARDGIGNVRFEQADAQVHPFPPAGFDLVISRAGTMFFGDPAAAFANLARALRPGGRLALLVWRSLADNPWAAECFAALATGGELPIPPPGAPGPFSMADPDRVRGLLTGAGFGGVRLDGVRCSMRFGADADDAHRFVSGQVAWLLDGLDDAARVVALDALRAVFAAHQGSDGVRLGSAAWLVTARR